jgi:hypothetical protein
MADRLLVPLALFSAMTGAIAAGVILWSVID